MDEREVTVDGRAVMVRDAGDPQGRPVVYFHGTPGSRLDVSFGEEIARTAGVRVISFDRPGYGRSESGAYSLVSIARDVADVVDRLGVDRFATLGWSGGGPFALAAAAVLGQRVTQVGVAGALAPFQEMPGAMDSFTGNDRAALAFLPDDPARAAEQFRVGNEEMLTALLSAREAEDTPWVDWMWGESDADVIKDPVMRRALTSLVREGLRQGATGICWDNVAWSGAWGFDLGAVLCPVHLWYGGRDRMAPLVNGQWLSENLPDATLTVHPEEGHLVPMRHWHQILAALV